MYTYSRPGTIAVVEFDGGAFHRVQPITLEHVQAVLRRVCGTDVTLTALLLATTWTDRAYHATAYRKGRVLLAGDAAHIHSPLGGQGLNILRRACLGRFSWARSSVRAEDCYWTSTPVNRFRRSQAAGVLGSHM
jgi:hypothetical protein